MSDAHGVARPAASSSSAEAVRVLMITHALDFLSMHMHGGLGFLVVPRCVRPMHPL